MKDQEKDRLKDIQEHIIFLGNRNDVYRLYNAMDVFVLPSRYEGLPVVGVEAQANGLPCLLSDKMTKETRMTENARFLGIENSIEEWTDKIHSCIKIKRQDSKEQLTKYGFNIEDQGEKLRDFYFNLLIKR